jgi:hypothetical protein
MVANRDVVSEYAIPVVAKVKERFGVGVDIIGIDLAAARGRHRRDRPTGRVPIVRGGLMS